MNQKTTGGPAFPTTVRTHYSEDTGSTWSEHIDHGMTLRDYFAAKAMQSLLELHHDVMRISDQDGWVTLHFRAYEHADAMLSARGTEKAREV